MPSHQHEALAAIRHLPPFFDSLVIVTPTNVVAQRMTKRFMREYHLVKKADRWRIQSSRQSQIQTFSP